MPKVVYCANCGTRLNVKRKALPKYGKIIDIVEYHECTDEPVPFDLTPVDVPQFVEKDGKNKFVQNLNDLQPEPSIEKLEQLGGLRDRRKEEDVKSETNSTAPPSLIQNLRSMTNSVPEKDLED